MEQLVERVIDHTQSGDRETPGHTGAAHSGPRQSVLRIPVGTNLAEAERWMILATLRQCGGNKTRAAALLGVSLKTLYNRLNAYRAQGLEVAELDNELIEVSA